METVAAVGVVATTVKAVDDATGGKLSEAANAAATAIKE